MPAYEFSAYLLSVALNAACGLFFWYLASGLLVARFPWSGLAAACVIFAVRYTFSTYVGQEPYDVYQLVKYALLFALSLALSCMLYKGRFLLLLYNASVCTALFEICFFLAYCLLHLGSIAGAALIDRELETGTDAEALLAFVEHIFIGLHVAVNAVLIVVCWICGRTLRRHFPKDGCLTTPELQHLLLPAVSGLLACLMLRLILFTVEDGMPVSVFDRNTPLFVLVPCIMLVLLLSILYSARTLQSMRRLARESSERIVLTEQLRLLEDQVAAAHKQNDAVNRMRHDLLNTISIVDRLSRQDPDALTTYLEALKSDARHALAFPGPYTGSTVADAVFSLKEKKLREAVPGASLDLSSFRVPALAGAAEYDLGIILSNALDNAIEGVGGDSPVIRCSAFTERGAMFLRIENSTSRPDSLPGSPFPETTKQGGLHGIGLRTIQTVAEKYGGTADWQVHEGFFTLSVMLGAPDGASPFAS